MAKLRAGVPLKTMLTASALAVTRSSDLPPGHHGGPLHPLVGLHALHNLVERLEGENRFLPVLQHVALANKHIHHPAMGPYALLDFEPMDEGGVEATKDAFFAAVNRGESNKADHYFLWLWDHMPPVEALDILLTVAIPKNVLDDHYFIFPALTFRAIEWMGREYLPVLMRPAVRYVARFPIAPGVPEIVLTPVGANNVIAQVTSVTNKGFSFTCSQLTSTATKVDVPSAGALNVGAAGAVVSTVIERVTDVGDELPAASVASALKLWTPSTSVSVVTTSITSLWRQTRQSSPIPSRSRSEVAAAALGAGCPAGHLT